MLQNQIFKVFDIILWSNGEFCKHFTNISWVRFEGFSSLRGFVRNSLRGVVSLSHAVFVRFIQNSNFDQKFGRIPRRIIQSLICEKTLKIWRNNLWILVSCALRNTQKAHINNVVDVYSISALISLFWNSSSNSKQRTTYYQRRTTNLE